MPKTQEEIELQNKLDAMEKERDLERIRANTATEDKEKLNASIVAKKQTELAGLLKKNGVSDPEVKSKKYSDIPFLDDMIGRENEIIAKREEEAKKKEDGSEDDSNKTNMESGTLKLNTDKDGGSTFTLPTGETVPIKNQNLHGSPRAHFMDPMKVPRRVATMGEYGRLNALPPDENFPYYRTVA